MADDRAQGTPWAPLSPEEVNAALKDMPNGKAPGTDVLTVAFYKASKAQLVPHLITLLEERWRYAPNDAGGIAHSLA